VKVTTDIGTAEFILVDGPGFQSPADQLAPLAALIPNGVWEAKPVAYGPKAMGR
jgi:hypothetical protein